MNAFLQHGSLCPGPCHALSVVIYHSDTRYILVCGLPPCTHASCVDDEANLLFIGQLVPWDLLSLGSQGSGAKDQKVHQTGLRSFPPGIKVGECSPKKLLFSESVDALKEQKLLRRAFPYFDPWRGTTKTCLVYSSSGNVALCA